MAADSLRHRPPRADHRPPAQAGPASSRRPAAKSPAFWCRPGRNAWAASKPPSRHWPAARSTAAIPRASSSSWSTRRTPARSGTTLNTIALLPDVYSASLVFHAIDAWSMIPKSGNRFSDEIMLKQERCRRIPMTAPKLDRRQVLKLEAAAMAALAGGMTRRAAAANLVTERAASELKWDKAPCRFCGTGCSVMVATKDNRVVATHWRHQVGGQSRPQLRERLFPLQDHVRPRPPDPADAAQDERQIRQERRVHAGHAGTKPSTSWRRSSRRALKKRGPSGVGMFGSGQWTIWEGYAGARS